MESDSEIKKNLAKNGHIKGLGNGISRRTQQLNDLSKNSNHSNDYGFRETSSSEEEEAQGSGPPGWVFQHYRKFGTYWNIFPKTDYTYLPSSPLHNKAVSPGVPVVPNMSRRPLSRCSSSLRTSIFDNSSEDTSDQTLKLGESLRDESHDGRDVRLQNTYNHFWSRRVEHRRFGNGTSSLSSVWWFVLTVLTMMIRTVVTTVTTVTKTCSSSLASLGRAVLATVSFLSLSRSRGRTPMWETSDSHAASFIARNNNNIVADRRDKIITDSIASSVTAFNLTGENLDAVTPKRRWLNDLCFILLPLLLLLLAGGFGLYHYQDEEGLFHSVWAKAASAGSQASSEVSSAVEGASAVLLAIGGWLWMQAVSLASSALGLFHVALSLLLAPLSMIRWGGGGDQGPVVPAIALPDEAWVRQLVQKVIDERGSGLQEFELEAKIKTMIAAEAKRNNLATEVSDEKSKAAMKAWQDKAEELAAAMNGWETRVDQMTKAIKERDSRSEETAVRQREEWESAFVRLEQRLGEVERSVGEGQDISQMVFKQMRAALESLQIKLNQLEVLMLDDSGHKNDPGPSEGQLAIKINSTENTSLDWSFVQSFILTSIEKVLSKYHADRTGLPDFALQSSGGDIVSIRCTVTFQGGGQKFLFGFPLWSHFTTPDMIIKPGIMPGECWAFVGSEGYVVIKLASKIRVTAFTMEHTPKELTSNGQFSSAPKDFSVKGLKEEHDPNPIDLGSFMFLDNGQSLQQYSALDYPEGLQMVELKVSSNHGNPEYTCLYRFRVHGTPVERTYN